MLQVASILLPDFSLIALGMLLRRRTNWGESFWSGSEKLVYFLLFPALLLQSTSRLHWNLAASGQLLQVSLLATLCAILLSWGGRLFIKSPALVYASGMQTAYRFNSYMALAIASRLAGEQGVGQIALLMGIGVPLCNVAAVHALARGGQGSKVLSEIARNPLMIATVCGLLMSAAGLHFPETVDVVLTRLGGASLALGLLLVGAGLRLSNMHAHKALSAYFTVIKLLVLPAIAYGLGRWYGLSPQQLQIVVLFSALPTASSCYVLSVRMGGDGPLTAFLISFGTLLSALTLPLWLTLVQPAV